jgi:hypothetical protein
MLGSADGTMSKLHSMTQMEQRSMILSLVAQAYMKLKLDNLPTVNVLTISLQLLKGQQHQALLFKIQMKMVKHRLLH